jgi:UDPglucose--hexose-1-phosphate uridylyltransferase
MSDLRQDPTTKEWVIIATERARRPSNFSQERTRQEFPPHDPSCPFCTGNESMTPDEVLRYPGEDREGWRLRVVPNRFPALTPGGDPTRRTENNLFRRMDGIGVHEVIIETPVHNQFTAFMDYTQMETVLHAYRSRYNALKSRPFLRYITIFKNHGEAAGTSLVHPHSQVIATPIAPSETRRKHQVAAAYYDDTGSCLYCDLVGREIAYGKRIVQETNSFVVFHPYASRSPFETWVAPKVHHSSFGLFSEEHVPQLARVLRDSMKALRDALNNPDYNLVIQTAPTDEEDDPYYDWHIRIIPRLTTVAGFEMGSGIYINTALPEETAAYMREQMASPQMP